MARAKGKSREVTPDSVPIVAYVYRRIPTGTGVVHDLQVGIDAEHYFPVRDATEATVAMLATALGSPRHRVTLYNVTGEPGARIVVE